MTDFVRACIVAYYTCVCLCLGSASFAQERLLREPQVECGLYFSDAYNTQGRRVSGLDADAFKDAFSKLDLENPPATLALVGVHPSQAAELHQSLKQTMSDLGLNDIPVTVIRRIESFIAQETGVFVKENGEWTKVAPLHPDRLKQELSNFENVGEREFLVVGMPLFGSQARAIKQTLEEHGITEYERQSKLKTYLSKAWHNPVAAGKDFMQKAAFMLPIREDLVPPSIEEKQSAIQKIIVPGMLTFSVLLAQGQELNILVPVTLMNAANSWSTGVFRSSIGNWWRRSTNFFPSKLTKNVMLTSFFTANLYWAGKGSISQLSQAITMMGWQNFITTKWLSILFTTMWRAPVANAIFQWEALRMQAASPDESAKIKAAGSAVEKYISYVMTQLFIYSLVTKSSLFNVVYSSTLGLQALPPDYAKAADQILLMDANLGHVSMAAIGTLAFIFMKKASLMDGLAAIALKVDRIESKITEVLKQPFGWVMNFFRKPTTIQEEPER